MPTIAFAGCAHIHTPGFISMLSRRPSFKVKRVWDHHRARGEQRARELDAEFVDQLEAIASDDGIVGVVVCSETDRHQAIVESLAAHGKHLFVEKPLGLAADDAYQTAEAIEKAGTRFQTGYFMRSQSSILTLKRLVDDGFFGKITRVRASNCHSGALGGWFDSKPDDPASDWRWMADPKQSGVGAFGDLGTHVLDLLLWMFGPAKTVTATLDMGTGRYDGCDETGEGVIVFDSGVIGTLTAAWDDIADPVKFQISGTKAMASLIEGKLHVTHADRKLDAVLSDAQPGLPHAFELWLDALEGKNVPLVGAREAAYRSAVMAAMYEAAKTPHLADAEAAVSISSEQVVINTKRVRNRRRLRFESLDALLTEATALASAEREGRLIQLGNWSLGQALNHLAVWVEHAYTGAPVPAPWIMRVVMRQLKPLVLRRGMIAGVRLRGTKDGTLGCEVTPTDVALAKLRAAFAHLAQEAPSKPNLLFGPLKHEEWIALQLRHGELHLGFFSTAEQQLN